MTLLGIASHFFSLVLTIVLAVSPNTRDFVAYIRGHNSENPQTVPEQESKTDSLFETFSDIVRRQLRADERYQQAAVLGAIETFSPSSKTSVEAALVNIFCTATGENSTRTVTGSGVFIDPRGVILTNAHIAQFLLLTEETARARTQCVVRQGSPAVAKYEAGVLYVSPAWVTKHAGELSLSKPSGTGEEDFALLYVAQALDGSAPDTFPSLVPAPHADLFSTMEVRAAGYPAEILATDTVDAPLVSGVATTSITQLFTFDDGTVDLVAIAPSAVGHQGSSGGPIVNEESSVVGLIVTRGNTLEEGLGSLRALTLSYIDRTLREETGLDLAHTASGNIALRAEVFHDTIAPFLRVLLLGNP